MAASLVFVTVALVASLGVSYYLHHGFRDLVVRYPVFSIMSLTYIILMIILVLYSQTSPLFSSKV